MVEKNTDKNVEYKGYQLPPLTRGQLIRRYKRFLADIKLETGEFITAHCPNSGSMKGCAIPGSLVWLSMSDNPKRKYRYTWELIRVPETLVGINTLVPNKLVKQSIEAGLIKNLSGFSRVTAEIKTSSHTRLDLLLENEAEEKCYVEIKNCTLVEDGTAMFPDAETKRGQKHLDELARLVLQGHRGVIFYLIQRMDANVFIPADRIDAVYGEKLRQAEKKGVEVIAMDTVINTEMIRIKNEVPVRLY